MTINTIIENFTPTIKIGNIYYGQYNFDQLNNIVTRVKICDTYSLDGTTIVESLIRECNIVPTIEEVEDILNSLDCYTIDAINMFKIYILNNIIAENKQLLNDTDYVVIRAFETGTDVPEDIKTERASARATINNAEDLIGQLCI